jgi:NAD+ kinase
MKNNPTFKRVALMGRHHPDYIEETIRAIHEFLSQHHYPIVYDDETAEKLSFPVTSVPAQDLHLHCDLLIVVGGDGSLLQAAKLAIAQSLPVLGVNRGRLGFLTDVYPQELAVITQVLAGDYQEELRFLLHAEIQHNHTTIACLEGLNEIVLSPGNVSHMIEFAISVDGQFVCDLRADGLIVATPTGSTAYALSGGGPILHPALNAMVLVPMFPHTLSNRPLVIDAESHLVIEITKNNEAEPQVSGDGQKRIPIALGASLLIQKKATALRLIHPRSYQYFQTLRSKLGWQSKNLSV